MLYRPMFHIEPRTGVISLGQVFDDGGLNRDFNTRCRDRLRLSLKERIFWGALLVLDRTARKCSKVFRIAHTTLQVDEPAESSAQARPEYYDAFRRRWRAIQATAMLRCVLLENLTNGLYSMHGAGACSAMGKMFVFNYLSI
jgi:hypothetical protein